MTLTLATLNDLDQILALQRECYQSEAALYNDFTIPPLVQKLESIQADFERVQFYKLEENNQIIASVRILLEGNTGKVGRLIVHPAHQNKGLGTKLMLFLESEFSDLERLELFTGHKSERNLYFYKKLDYREYKRHLVNEKLTLVFLEKWLSMIK